MAGSAQGGVSSAAASTASPGPEGPQAVDDALRAVADPTRRMILRLVRDGERAAGAIAAQFPTMSRPAVSQHLRVLADAHLVEMRKDGNRRLYRARPEGLDEIWAFIDEMWASNLARLKATVEADGARRRAQQPAAQQPAAQQPGGREA